MRRKNICIVGGGRLAHLFATLASRDGSHNVSMLTSQAMLINGVMPPEGLRAIFPNGDVATGRPTDVTDAPQRVVPDADIILFAVPAHIRPSMLASIAPFIGRDRHVYVGAVPGNGGFDWLVRRSLPRNVIAWGLRDAPYTAYDLKPGRSVTVGGGPRHHYLATDHGQSTGTDECAAILADLLAIQLSPVASFLELTLALGNPVLHLPALYGLAGPNSENPNRRFTTPLGWWKDLTDLGAFYVERCAGEQYQLIEAVRRNLSLEIGSLIPLDEDLTINYGESMSDTSTIASMLRTNRAFKGMVPLVPAADGAGLMLDYQHRIFQEDTYHGLHLLITLAQATSVPMPAIEEIWNWVSSLVPPTHGRASDYVSESFLESLTTTRPPKRLTARMPH